jgi:hypothetical protein
MYVDHSLLIAYVDGSLAPKARDQVDHEIECSNIVRAQVERLWASRIDPVAIGICPEVPPVPRRLLVFVRKVCSSSCDARSEK